MNLNELLSQPDVSVPQLFQQPDILNQIKYKIQIFVEFCKRNEDFTKIMITLGIKTPMYRNQNLDMRKVSHVASDFLTCDNDQIAQLFVIDKSAQRIRCYSEDDDQIMQQIVSNQTTGQLTIADPKPQKEMEEFEKKYMYLNELLSYLYQKYLDENCINYMAKVLNTVIRVKPQQVYQYFIKKPDLLKKMVQLTCYPSVSYTLVKFINQFEDSQYRQYKLDVINMIVKQLLEKVANPNFPVYLQFVDEVFDKNRHRTQQQDELKLVSQPLVGKQIVQQMVNKALTSTNNNQISNSILYLLKVVDRMNIDQEKDPYSYTQQDNTNKPTMDFQVGSLFASFDLFVDKALRMTRQIYNPHQILWFYDVLIGMTKHSKFKQVKINNNNNILTLLKAFNLNQSKFNGIIKNKIVMLIEIILNCHAPQQVNFKITNQIVQQLQKLNYISSENTCFRQKLLILFPRDIESLKQIHFKYSGLLTPTNYTENRTLKIKELQFVKKQLVAKTNNNNIQTEKDKIDQQQPVRIQTKSDDQIPATDEQVNNKQVLSFSNRNGGINLEALNGKINAIKNKKQQKIEEQIQRKKLQQTPNKDQENTIKAKKQTKQNENQIPIKQQKTKKSDFVTYYAKHLILF